MKKIALVILALVFMTGFAFAANCPPSIPKVYSGGIYDGSGFIFDEKLDDAEYPLRAMIGSDIVGYTTVIGGDYSIKIEPCFGSTGDVTFVINGVEADQTGIYAGKEDWGVSEDLDLVFNPRPPASDTCGDSAIQLGEECDGINLGGRDVNACGDGWAGTISCDSTCGISYSNCSLIPVAYCGDGIINNGETCSTCPADVGVCDSSGDNTGGDGGDDGGSSTGGSTSSGESIITVDSASATSDDNSNEDLSGLGIQELNTESNDAVEGEGFFSGITGAATGGMSPVGKVVLWVVVIFVIVALAYVLFMRKVSVKKK